MNGWEMALIIMMAVGMGISLQRHGKEKEGKYSFFTDLFALIVNVAILWKAGLWH